MQFDPVGGVVVYLCDAVQKLLPESLRYNEGYRMNPVKEIGS